MNLFEYEYEKDYKRFRYSGRFWTPIDICIFYDSSSYQYAAMHIRAGLFGFESTHSVTNKISRAIQSYVDAESAS